MALRGGDFAESFENFRMFRRLYDDSASPVVGRKQPLCIGVMHIGAPTPGMNAAVRAAVSLAYQNGIAHEVCVYCAVE